MTEIQTGDGSTPAINVGVSVALTTPIGMS